MKTKEKIKVQIMLIVIIFISIFAGCAILELIEKILMKLNPVILIVAFCYLLYKILMKEV